MLRCWPLFALLPFPSCLFTLWWGEEDSNLRRLSQQIYSLPRLTASVSPRVFFNMFMNEPVEGFEPPTG